MLCHPSSQTIPTTTSKENSTQSAIVNPGVRDLEQEIDKVSKLRNIATALQDKYDILVIAVKKSLEDHCIDVKDAKRLIKECLKRKACVVSNLVPCIDILEKANDFESFFDFRSNHDFIGYLNYKLLKKLAVLVKNDKEIKKHFFGYEKEYAKLLASTSFQDLIPLFNEQSDSSPTAPLGLPYISFHFEKPWLPTCVYTWVSTFGEFSWSEDAFLKQLRKKCVIVTYAILPCVFDDVMRDLTDPVILKKLKDKGITVIELPQEEKDSQIEDNSNEGLISSGNSQERSSIIKTAKDTLPTTLTREVSMPQGHSRTATFEVKTKIKSYSLIAIVNPENLTQPAIVNPGVRDLEQKIDKVSKLRNIATALQDKYDILVIAVKKSLEDHCIDVKDAKRLIKGCLKRKACVVSNLMPCIGILEKTNDFESFFDFLSNHDFIGYLNYKLLKKLAVLVKNDKDIKMDFFGYEKEYAKLLASTSFQDLIPFFEEQSDSSPTAPLGLPYISFRFEKP
ncbi:PREDICTED: uncharacterized protein LOC109582068 [Amphimedon queenslandica]|uniref:Uncharacterized protein n=1 Tax=Amphimedon queenslandica TaxID=400682 RepID=A0AAN0J638_AMPQE|nr:PREDICTED: uncharacterized protein LOC109582068 [Amphimedon queenslandica]|eukprot:XP_019852217.1 PREDICTED: uncharacterized protein LOC109582068 [Amphimedon queenslandica]